jgi:hypothetical protein
MRMVERVLVACLVGFAAGPLVAQSRALQIDAIDPASGRVGDRVTITGREFGGRNVRIAVNGIPAAVLAARGHDATFLVPQGVTPGPGVVIATNPGGSSGSIPFLVLGDGLLPGSPNALANDALFDLPPVAAPQTDIEAGVIMTRLDLRLAPTATVGEVNSALTGIGARIASMSPGFLTLTIAVPRQASVEALQGLVATLETAPGIEYAGLAVTNAIDELPSENVSSLDPQLLPTRFPAAWNARNVVVNSTGQCRGSRVKILIGDHFRRPAPSVVDVGATLRDFLSEIPHFLPSPIDENVDSTHGYDVTLLLGAQFNPEARTGANPFSDCLDITGVQLGGLSSYQEIDRLARNFPVGKFILNYSKGYESECKDPAPPPAQGTVTVPCGTQHFRTRIPRAITRAQEMFYWKERTFALWDNFLVTAAAGNGRSRESAGIYPILGTVWFSSYLNAAKSPDPFLGFAADTSLWQATPEREAAGFTSLAATSQQAFVLRETILAGGLDTVGGAPNVLSVGSTTAGLTFTDLQASSFSNTGADVSAVGQGLLKHDGTDLQGTSFTAPRSPGWRLTSGCSRPPSARRRHRSHAGRSWKTPERPRRPARSSTPTRQCCRSMR